MFRKINLKEELERRQRAEDEIFGQVEEILHAAEVRDHETASRLKRSPVNARVVSVQPSGREVFTLETIRKVCIRYRLRFLDTSFYKGELPYEALMSIHAFEEAHGVKLEKFKILAPGEAFELEDVNKDPLLFAELENRKYYLLHRWGNELSWYRRFLYLPIRSFGSFLIFLAIICFAFSFSIPADVMNVFSRESEMYLRIWLAIHSFIGILGLSLWAGFAFDVNFSNMSWNSKYYNM